MGNLGQCCTASFRLKGKRPNVLVTQRPCFMNQGTRLSLVVWNPVRAPVNLRCIRRSRLVNVSKRDGGKTCGVGMEIEAIYRLPESSSSRERFLSNLCCRIF